MRNFKMKNLQLFECEKINWIKSTMLAVHTLEYIHILLHGEIGVGEVAVGEISD